MKAILYTSAAVVLAALLLIAYSGSDKPQIVRFLILSQIAFIGYWTFLIAAHKRPRLASGGSVLFPIIVTFIVVRIIVAFAAGERTDLSDDVYRYIWEGKIVAHGYNPYVLSPRDLSHSGFTDQTIYPKINHPWLPTIYPPVSQVLFAFAYLIGGNSLAGFKLLSLTFELLTLLILTLLVREFCAERWQILVYALCPLVIIEFLFSNHLDILAMPFFMISLILLKRRNAIGAAITIALAVLIKLLALLVVPVFFLTFTGRKRWLFAGFFAAVVALFYSPFLVTSGLASFGSLWTYLGTWQYNGSIFALLMWPLDPAVARGVCAGLFLLAVLLILFYRRRSRPPMQQMFWILGAYVILTPSLFPWYLIWLLPFLVLNRNAAYLALTGTVMLSYHVLIGHYASGSWSQYPILNVIEYLPFYALLAWLGLRQLRSREPVAS